METFMNRYSNKSKMMFCSMALALTALAAGCGGGSGGGAAGGGAGEAFATTNNSTDAGAVNLGTAASFAILAKAAVSTTGTTAIVGHVGVSPAAETFLTGFSQARAAPNTYSTSSLVTGWLFAADMAPPTPTQMTTAIGDMEIAYTDAATRPAGVGANLNLGAGTLTNATLAPGTYTWGTDLNIPTNLTLSGNATDVWIFQINGNLTQASGTRVTLAGGALPKNIFWQLTGAATINTTAHFEGIILSQTAISMLNGATINGRLLAQTAVTLDANAVAQP
jgi:hypothetical protein